MVDAAGTQGCTSLAVPVLSCDLCTAPGTGGKDAISKCSGQYDAANWLLSAEEDIQRDGSSDASDQVQHSFQPTRFDKELVFVAGYACRNPSAWTVFKTWNVELKWMATSAWLQEAVKKSADLHGMLVHHQQVILMQSHHLRDFCKSCLSTACSQLDVFRLQRLVAAVARLTLRQRMQLVFEGYRARFAKIGAITLGDLDYLNQADLTALQLTPVTLDTMVKCMQSGLCKTPIALEFPDAVSRPHMLIKAWLKSFGLGSCASLFDKQGLHTMQDVPMLSEEDMLSWQGRFKQGLPFRKLKKLFASLRLNLWWSQMHANGYLPQNCKSVRDLVLYDVDELCERIHGDCSLRTRRQGFISHNYANMVPTTLMFKQQA
ncbi:TPA: Nuclear pore complex protein Nup98-Nup96 [Trebouxia sp. C0006]